MGASAAHALDDGGVGHVDFDHVVELDAGGLHGVGLRNGAWEAVEQKALGAIGLGDALLDQADDDVVADQAAGVHHLLGLHAQRRAGLDGGAQHVAGGDLRDAVLLADEGGLRAFAGTGCAQQDQSHRVPLWMLWRVPSKRE